MVRYRIALVAILAVMTIPMTAFAGGWAIASFDEVPGDFQAGATYDLEYTILQHGETPVDVGNSQVRIVDCQWNASLPSMPCQLVRRAGTRSRSPSRNRAPGNGK